MVLKKCDIHMLRKNEPRPHTPYRKFSSKQNRELNIKYKTIELLEQEESFITLNEAEFLGMVSKSQPIDNN